MRLIGKGSVASGVRWLLGFINIFVSIALLVMVPVALFSIVVPDFAAGFLDGFASEWADRNAGRTPGDLIVSAMVCVSTVIIGLTWLIINRLRKIFATLTQGDPFQPANVRWLQTVGAALAGIELSDMVLPMLFPRGPGEALGLDVGGFEFELTAWLGVLIVFILAEVFREGARMRDDTRMTV